MQRHLQARGGLAYARAGPRPVPAHTAASSSLQSSRRLGVRLVLGPPSRREAWLSPQSSPHHRCPAAPPTNALPKQLAGPLLDWLSGVTAKTMSMRDDMLRGEDEAGPSPLNIDQDKLPKHVAVIMDGNGRWAAERGRPAAFGHDQGVRALRKLVECCGKWKIPYVTVYAFSTENWRRDESEVSFLFGLMERVLTQELGDMAESGVRLRFLGERSRLPESLRGSMERAEEATADNTALALNIAISYSGRQDLTNAVKSIARRVAEGELSVDEVNDDLISDHLTTAQLPQGARAPDLVIRTSGEQRLSNFLLWESAYSELYFTPVYWPDFGEQELRDALEAYAARDRRYGRRTTASAAASTSTSTSSANPAANGAAAAAAAGAGAGASAGVNGLGHPSKASLPPRAAPATPAAAAAALQHSQKQQQTQQQTDSSNGAAPSLARQHGGAPRQQQQQQQHTQLLRPAEAAPGNGGGSSGGIGSGKVTPAGLVPTALAADGRALHANGLCQPGAAAAAAGMPGSPLP